MRLNKISLVQKAQEAWVVKVNLRSPTQLSIWMLTMFSSSSIHKWNLHLPDSKPNPSQLKIMSKTFSRNPWSLPVTILKLLLDQDLFDQDKALTVNNHLAVNCWIFYQAASKSLHLSNTMKVKKQFPNLCRRLISMAMNMLFMLSGLTEPKYCGKIFKITLIIKKVIQLRTDLQREKRSCNSWKKITITNTTSLMQGNSC